jgi:Heterokaryon incompatibility protein (HET)
MRLLKVDADGCFSLTTFADDNLPSYAILSHTWGDQEVTYQDLIDGIYNTKSGFTKLQFCADQSCKDGLQYFWADVCCINKSDMNELATAINSMFRWYQNSAKCYVYLSDVANQDSQSLAPYEAAFRKSRWYTRGWTLQELLAPRSVEFFTRERRYIGDKVSLKLQIQEITSIPSLALEGMPMSQFSVDERMSWIATRETTVKEDKAYCLLGIFNVFLPLIYGEGLDHAFTRLKNEIENHSSTKILEQGNKRKASVPAISRKEQRKRAKMNSEELECLRVLRTTDYEQFKNRNPSRLEGTCQWFLQHNNFKSWQHRDTSSLLWVSTDPGCGK